MRYFIISLLLLLTAFPVAARPLQTVDTSLEARFTRLQQDFNKKIAALERQTEDLKKQIAGLLKAQKALTSAALVQNVKPRSQDDLLTSAVSAVSPSVVSVVVSKDVSLLEVVFQKPFGESGPKIPSYQKKGILHKKVGAGTGFFVAADGYIITNKHVVADENAEYTVLIADGSQKQGKVFYRDPNYDLALIKIEGDSYPVINLGNSDQGKLGQTVIAIGNALGEYSNSVSVGILSGVNRKITASANGTTEELTDVLQTDAAINPGNSGGPLVDLDGRVIGINVATIVGSQSISFSIPSNRIRDVVSLVLGRRM